MKLLSRHLDKNSWGTIEVIPENDEDIWLLYNLVQVGDEIKSKTTRKVHQDSETGSVNVKTCQTVLKIKIEKINYNLQDSNLSFNGRNIAANKFVKIGAYHTLCIQPQTKFTISKSCWDAISVDLVEKASDPAQQADLAAVIMQEGLAYVCLVTSSLTIVRAKIDIAIPKKGFGYASNRKEEALTRFFNYIIQAIERYINFEIVKCVIVASPGFVRDSFLNHAFETWKQQPEKKAFVDQRRKFVSVHSSSGHKHALQEILRDPSVAKLAQDTKIFREARALEQFFVQLKCDASRAFYGFRQCEAACEAGAVADLLISDAQFRKADAQHRQRCVTLMESVAERGGIVHVLSSQHAAGEQLGQICGVAVILRFPMEELEDLDLTDDERDGDEDEEREEAAEAEEEVNDVTNVEEEIINQANDYAENEDDDIDVNANMTGQAKRAGNPGFECGTTLW